MQRVPATVVEQFQTMVRKDGYMWAFGYDLVPGQANARCWYDATMPIYHVEKAEHAKLLSVFASKMVKAARHVSGAVLSAVIKATMLKPQSKQRNDQTGWIEVVWDWPRDLLNRLKRSPKEKNEKLKAELKDGENIESRIESSLLNHFNEIRLHFWRVTEKDFYQCFRGIRDALEKDEKETAALEGWLLHLQKDGLAIFDTYSQNGNFDATDPRRIALARNELAGLLYGNMLRTTLGLPKKEKESTQEIGGADGSNYENSTAVSQK